MAELTERARDGEAASRPGIERVLSHPAILVLCQAVAIGAIFLRDRFLPDNLASILIDPERSTYPVTVQNLMWLVAALGIGELFVRFRDALAERAQLRKGYLPEAANE